MAHQVVLLSEDWLDQAAAVMARAFCDYPLFISVFPDRAERSRVVHAMQGWAVRHGHQFGEVAGIGNPLVGMTLMFPPDDDPFSPERLAESNFDEVADRVGAAAWEKLSTAPQQFYGEAQLDRAMTESHWHLDAVAVDPAHQGMGIGGILLEAIHAKTDADGRPVALVTHDPRTIPSYLRHGYQLILEGMEPTSGVPHCGFRRAPQS